MSSETPASEPLPSAPDSPLPAPSNETPASEPLPSAPDSPLPAPTDETKVESPAEDFQFRIRGYQSEQVIFSRTHLQPEVGIWELQPVHDDHWFTLIHGTGDKEGLYAFKSANTGKVLFSRRHEYPTVGHIDGDGIHDDNWFKFEEGTGEFAKYYRLITPSAGMALVSRKHLEPHFTNFPASAEVYPDQYFSFLSKSDGFERDPRAPEKGIQT